MSIKVERARTKAFYKLLVDRIGEDVWAKRRITFLEKIRSKELRIDLNKPIEPQLFQPPEDDIDWYILVAELAYDVPYSDCAYSSRRIYPYSMAIGAFSQQLQEISNVGRVLDKMLANNSQPETQLFELLTGQPLKPSATPSPVRCRHAKNLLSLNNPRACRHDDDARRQLQHARHC